MSMTPFSRPAAISRGDGHGSPAAAAAGARPLTGRRVLTYFLAFFLVIIVVNGVMATIASRSFRGVVADNGYVESLRFSAFEKHGAAALEHARPPLEGPLPSAAAGAPEDGGR